MLVFEKAKNTLKWGNESYIVRSGPFQKKEIPNGEYEVRKYHVVVGGGLGRGMTNNLTGERWFIPIRSMFHSVRTGLGIHPDGTPPVGTRGCIGIRNDHAKLFWHRWTKQTSMANRPTRLMVKP